MHEMMRKKMRNRWYAAVLAGSMLALGLGGCGSQGTSTSAGTAETTAAAESAAETSEVKEAANAADSETVTVQLGEGKEKTIVYEPEDLDAEWDESQAAGIVFNDKEASVTGKGASASGTVVTITQSGTYVVSGTSADCQIRIDADKKDEIHLVLNGAELSNTTSAVIYGVQKSKVILTLEPGTENIIQDGAEYQFDDPNEDEPNAAIFTKGDLTINGTGALQVSGNYECGIRSKGDLKVISGVLTIQAQSDGLKGKESVVIRDGVFTIEAGKDGIKSNEDQDEDAGYIWIDGGDITIAADDDGIQAETALVVNGGTITITKCQEGLAGKTVDILGGLIKADAQDDGINSAASVETEMEKMMDQEGVYTRIAGGEIWLNAAADGIDSNGDLYIEGGTLYLTGPEHGGDGILDYNGKAYLTGGTVFAAGTAGMMQTFDASSTQNYIVMYYSETQPAGTLIQLMDSTGAELGSYAPEKRFEAAIISSPELAQGDTYRVVTGEDTVEVTVDGIENVSGEASFQNGFGGRPMGQPGEGGMMRGGGRGGEGGENGMPPEWNGEFPEGENGEDGTMRGGGRAGEGRGNGMPRGGGPAGEAGEHGMPPGAEGSGQTTASDEAGSPQETQLLPADE